MSADKTELRGLVPAHLGAALDAIAMARGMDRHSYVTAVLDAEVKRVAHEAMVLHRALRGNPYGSDADGVGVESRARLHA